MATDQIFNEDFKIPDRFVGLVIGRAGEQIKRLQQESQCKIRIASESDGTAERSCTLTGSQQAIDHAKHMLDEVIRRGQNRAFQQQQNGGYQPQQQNYNGGGGYHNNGGGYSNRRY